ncbi:MAG: ParA family protein [Deltaproteobacteria bacterium]|nr:ParA family protein [Deltaproteobacteria bacterium]
MEPFVYTPKRAAQILGITQAQLQREAKQAELTPQQVQKLREKLGKSPHDFGGCRRQLFLNFKGGTGKTSLSTSYAFRLAEMGYGVLLVDLDSQGHATKCLGLEGENLDKTLLPVFTKKLRITDVIMPTGVPLLDLVPSNLSMSTVDLTLMPMAGRELKLRTALKEVEDRYDFIVLDAPPSFGLLNLNALMATDDLFVPVLADFLSFHGLKLLFETVQGLQEDLDLQLANVFIVVNAFNQTFKIAREALEALKQHYPEYLLKTVVRQCTKFAQASSEGKPVFAFDPECKGATDIQAVIDEAMGRVAESVQSRRAGS